MAKQERKRKQRPGPGARGLDGMGWGRSVAHLFRPGQWSLRAKILHISGLLLTLGCLFQVLYLSMVLSESMDAMAEKRLSLLKSRMLAEMTHMRRNAMSHAMALASMEVVRDALATGDREGLRNFSLPYADGLRFALGISSLDVFFMTRERQVFLRTDRPNAAGQSFEQDMLLMDAGRDLNTVSGLDATGETPLMRAVSPVMSGVSYVGSVDLRIDLADVFQGLEVSEDEGVSIYIAGDAAEGHRLAWKNAAGVGVRPPPSLRPEQAQGRTLSEEGHYYLSIPLNGLTADMHGVLMLSYDASFPIRQGNNRIYQLAGLFIPGAMFLWLMLHLNVSRIETFLAMLKRVIVASHSNEFKIRFETDTVHCLELMNCHKEECPVYQDPSRVCYLETGSESISPRWRNTCVFLKTYSHCRNCPVYALRKGDEIEEMRGVVNTFMHLWSTFLGRTGHLLAYVLHSQDMGVRLPSLDEVSERLEQMAKLTFFSHDLQGTLNREEVYLQLSHVVRENFHIDHFILFSFDNDSGHVGLALDESGGFPLCSQDVPLSPRMCRANRVAEEVLSYNNPTLCPYFNCDNATHYRICLPMVMNGQVGGVFTAILENSSWQEIRNSLPMLRKYLAEASPVLSSLRLLAASREQTLRDALTGCHNRRFLDEFISKYEPLSRRNNTLLGFLMCDLDYFKQVNDQYGHDAGDAVLKQVVAVIRSVLRRSDLLIRYGGEEFLVLLLEVEPGASDMVAEKIRSGMEQEPLVLPGGESIHKTISVGVAEYPTDGDSPYKAIKFADVALYEAKKGGRNRVRHFDRSMWEEKDY